MSTEHVARASSAASPRNGAWLPRTLLFTNLVAILLIAWALTQFGSILAAPRSAPGPRLTVDAVSKSFGLAVGDERLAVTFELRNESDSPIRILGSNSDCICSVPRNVLPLQIGPRERVPFRVNLHLPSDAQDLETRIILYTNDLDHPELNLAVTGLILDPGSSPDS